MNVKQALKINTALPLKKIRMHQDGTLKNKRADSCESTLLFCMAEGGRFELPVACATTDFESVTFGLSDTPPNYSVVFFAFFFARSSRKKPLSSSLHSACITPSVTSTRWLKRSSLEKS